jgi:hypothetical protein
MWWMKYVLFVWIYLYVLNKLDQWCDVYEIIWIIEIFLYEKSALYTASKNGLAKEIINKHTKITSFLTIFNQKPWANKIIKIFANGYLFKTDSINPFPNGF